MRVKFNSGQEVIYEDLDAIFSLSEKQVLDRIVYELMERKTNGFLFESFKVDYSSANEVIVNKGIGFQSIDENGEEPTNALIYLDEPMTVGLDAADAADPRIDLIIVRSTRINSKTENRKWKPEELSDVQETDFTTRTDWSSEIQVITGIPGPSPEAGLVPDGFIVLASVFITPVLGIQSQDYILDERELLPALVDPIEVVKKSQDQTFTGQNTFTKPIIILNQESVDTPPPGSRAIYPTENGWMTKAPDGDEVPLGSGSGGLPIVTFYDPIIEASDFPIGPSYTVDGVSAQNGDTVLASKMGNKVYQIQGVGSEITFSELRVFKDFTTSPIAGESVRIQKGDSFKNQILVFDGTDFKVNDTVRLFDGLNYHELSSVKSLDLINNSLNEVFNVSALGSENFIINYSFKRGSLKELGQIFLTSNGSDVSITTKTAGDDCGLEFSGIVDSGNLILSALLSDTGQDGNLKYLVTRWSDHAGGPGGIPNYQTSPISGGSGDPISAAGSVGDIQFKGSDGNLNADSRLKWSTLEGSLSLGGLNFSSLSSSLSILDDQDEFQTVVSWPDDKYFHVVMEYSVRRGSHFRTGRFLIANNDEGDVEFNEDFIESSPLGITFQVISEDDLIKLQYTSDLRSITGSFKYSLRGWK
jgi:hypothetical protein